MAAFECPVCEFVYDETTDRALRVDALIDGIEHT